VDINLHFDSMDAIFLEREKYSSEEQKHKSLFQMKTIN